jgi:hypothetical protein
MTRLPSLAATCVLLAQEDSSTASILFWSLLLIVLVIGLFVVVVILRKKMSPNEDFHGAGFTLADLRQMHKSGKMSDEEFQRAKVALLGSLAKPVAKSAQDVETKNLTPPA